MLSLKIKDISLRQRFLKLEKKKLVNKFLFINILNKKNNFVINTCSFLSLLRQKSIKKINSKIKIQNRCTLSNRGRGVLRSHSLSRIILREYMQFGIIPGYAKSVW